MKSRLAVLFAVAALLAPSALAQQRPPELPFDSNPEFLQMPAGMNFGEVPGVAVNSKGHVFVFTRAPSGGGSAFMPAAAQLFEFGPNGEFVREIGRNLYAWAEAHSVRIDKDDNIWAIDKGSDMVVKFNPAGRVMMVFGRRKESVDEDSKPWQRDRNPPLPAIEGLFREPTDVAWDSAGNIYITDGYINSRVAKYDKDGNWVTSWGDHGTGPGQFNLPHAIAIDSHDNIYVGDRTNRRIQIFDTAGKFLRMFTIDVPPDPATRAVYGNTPTGAALAAVSGQPNSICITPAPNQVMFIGESPYPGRIFKVSLDGQVLGVIGRSGRQPKTFSGAHALACPSDHEIYAAETANWRVQKVTLRQQAATSGATPAAAVSDLHVISSIGIRGALQKMLPEFERASGRKVVVDWGTTAGLKRELEGGRTFDVTILTPGAIDDLIKEHIIADGTHTDIAQTFLGIGVRPGAPRADVSTAAAIKRRLLAAKTITFSKEGASTAALLEMMQRLGIADEMAAKTVLQTVSGRPAESVMEGQNEIVLAPLSELRVAGIQILGPLPKEFQVPVVMSAGIATASTNAAAAKALVQFLTSSKMIPLITAAGMEVVR